MLNNNVRKVEILIYKVKLKFRTKEHETYWKRALEVTALAYNDIVSMIVDNKCPLSLKPVHDLVYKPCREKYPNVPAQVIVKAYKRAIENLRTSKGKSKSHPRMKNKTMLLDRCTFSCFTSESFKLSSEKAKCREFVDIVGYKKFNDLMSLYKTENPEIYIKNDELWLAVPFEIPDKPVTGKDRLGVDLGIRRIFTTSDGKSFKGSKINSIKRRIRYNKSKLKSVRNKKKSKSAIRKLKKIGHKEANITRNFAHEVANKILDTDKSIIVLENLKGIKQKTKSIKNGVKRKKHNNRISQVPFYTIKQILTYKAPLLGKKVVTVSPAYTSQINSLTGKKNGERKGCRYYTKKKGLVLDADWNAAINIAKRYSRHSQSFMTPYDGGLTFETGCVSISQKQGRMPLVNS